MKTLIKRIILWIPAFERYYWFKHTITNRVALIDYIRFKLRRDKQIYWPVHKNSEVTNPQNIFVGINTNPGTRPGCYIQGNGGIKIGNYVHFASNIGIISGNHDPYDQTKHIAKPVEIGNYSWIGQGVIILPGVTLGERTIVGAGSVVTHSFLDGYCIIAGNPAKLIKKLEPGKFKPTEFKAEYLGFIPRKEFVTFAAKHLKKNLYYSEMSTIR